MVARFRFQKLLRKWQKYLFPLTLVLTLLLSQISWFPPPAIAQVAVPCATPGKDGVGTPTSIINTYYPSPVTASVNAGATAIPVGTPVGAATPIAAGDLLLVMQMQDATFDSSDTASYGDGTPGDVPPFAPPGPPYTDPPSTSASGYLTTTAGTYEYVVATGPIVGGAVPIAGAGAGGGLLNSYNSAPATPVANPTKGQSTYQVVRVPQYSSASLGSAAPAVALPWNGRAGGIVAYDVAGNLTLSGTINVSGRGFRGGGGRRYSGAGGVLNSTFRTLSTLTVNGSKAEGIAGTPFYVNQPNFDAAGNPITTPNRSTTGAEGYPNGSFGRGAPGNAGGGSTDGTPANNAQNSGGGGGANGGRGGRGGRAFSSQFPTGGLAGKEFPASTTRLIMGGGGGSGTSNNASFYISATNFSDGTDLGGSTDLANAHYSSGAAGGGIVMIRANTASGAGGAILARGGSAANVTRDGGGGGGAGGSVIIVTRTGGLTGLTVDVSGGKGGDALFATAHGPGGGGGGGVIVTSDPTGITANLNGGAAGVTSPNPLGLNFTSESGVGLAIPLTAGPIPGVRSGAECVPVLTTAKRTTTPNVVNQPNGGTATYTITVNAAADRSTATGVVIGDTLPAGFTYAATTTINLSGGATQPTVSNPTVGSATPNWGNFDIPAGGQVQITFTTNVATSVQPGTYQNPATAQYLDPLRTTATGTATATYDPASSTDEDVTIAATPPNLRLVKRTTRLNGTVFNNPATDLINDPADPNDDPTLNWPNGYLLGRTGRGVTAADVVTPAPGDIVEYTIYFLSDGGRDVRNANLCDLVPLNTTLVTDGLNALPQAAGGTAGADRGVSIALNGTELSYTNTLDGDIAEVYALGTPIPVPAGGTAPQPCTAANVATNGNGAVVVRLGDVPRSTAIGAPPASFGLVRFRVRVN